VLGCAGAMALLLAGSCGLLFMVDWDKLSEEGTATSTPEPTATPAPLASDDTSTSEPAEPSPDAASEQAPEEDNGAAAPADSEENAGEDMVEIEITSEPESCRVTIDGHHAGFTPMTETVEAGPHQVACAWKGMGRRSLEANISQDHRRLHFKL